jgi:Fur family transcriptional regulator, peroxide stress response regulator
LTNDNIYRLLDHVNAAEIKHFRELCVQHGLAVTHQRQVIYEVLQEMTGHPSPEEVYARVRKKIPAISLATVYKNINLFLESGLFREVSLHHGSLRVEINSHPHHHLVCTSCRSIYDIDEKELGALQIPSKLAGGFLVTRLAVDVLGLCSACQQKPVDEDGNLPGKPS